MAAQVKEWTTIQQFPAATQEKLVDLLGKLKNQVHSYISSLSLTYSHCIVYIKSRQRYNFMKLELLYVYLKALYGCHFIGLIVLN